MDASYSDNPVMFRRNPIGIVLVTVVIRRMKLLVSHRRSRSTPREYAGNDLLAGAGLAYRGERINNAKPRRPAGDMAGVLGQKALRAGGSG